MTNICSFLWVSHRHSISTLLVILCFDFSSILQQYLAHSSARALILLELLMSLFFHWTYLPYWSMFFNRIIKNGCEIKVDFCVKWKVFHHIDKHWVFKCNFLVYTSHIWLWSTKNEPIKAIWTCWRSRLRIAFTFTVELDFFFFCLAATMNISKVSRHTNQIVFFLVAWNTLREIGRTQNIRWIYSICFDFSFVRTFSIHINTCRRFAWHNCIYLYAYL